MMKLIAWVENRTYHRVKELAERNGVTISDIAQFALDSYLAEQEMFRGRAVPSWKDTVDDERKL